MPTQINHSFKEKHFLNCYSKFLIELKINYGREIKHGNFITLTGHYDYINLKEHFLSIASKIPSDFQF